MSKETTNFSQELLADAFAAIRELEQKEAAELIADEANYTKALDEELSKMQTQVSSENEAFTNRETAKSSSKLKDLDKEIAELEPAVDLEPAVGLEATASKGKKRSSKNISTIRLESIQNVQARRLIIKRAIIKEGKIGLLSEIIPNHIIKQIIPHKTVSIVESIAKYKDTINRRIANSMAPLFPEKIRVARALCGTRPFKEHPGFLWKTPKEYGEYSMWVTPDIPYFFDQFTEMQIMRERCDIRKIASIDKAVQTYMQSVAALGKREASLAIKLVRINTFEELLNFDVEAFQFAYGLYKKQQQEEAELLRSENKEDLAAAAEANLIDMEQIEAEMEAYYAGIAKSAEGFATDKKE